MSEEVTAQNQQEEVQETPVEFSQEEITDQENLVNTAKMANDNDFGTDEQSSETTVVSILGDDAAKHAKVKKPIGKAIAKVEQVARNAYKKGINPNTTAIADDMADDVVNAIHAQNNRALQKMVGIGTAAAVLPAATTISNDGDEVPDMLQKFEAGANKVTGATTRATADLTALQNLVDIVASAGA